MYVCCRHIFNIVSGPSSVSLMDQALVLCLTTSGFKFFHHIFYYSIILLLFTTYCLLFYYSTNTFTSCLLPCCCSLQRVVAGDWLRRATRSQEHPVCQSHPCQAHCGPILRHKRHLHLHFSLAHRLIRRHRAGKITR